jgi:hypothetical protein
VNRPSAASIVLGSALRFVPLAAVAALLLMAVATPVLRAVEAVIEVGPAAAKSRAPRWDARGLGQLPWQGIACLDVTEDGRWIAAGTIAPPGDPNLFLLDQNGKLLRQHRAGQRWVNEVADWNGDGIPDLILSRRGKPGVSILLGSPADCLSPERTVSVDLDYTPHFDTRFGVADFLGDGRVGLAGFGQSPAGAMGVYIWLQPGSGAK